MSKRLHEKLIRRYFDEVWNQGKIEVLDEIIASNYINHSPGAGHPIPGPEGLKPIVAALRTAFPDLKYTIEDMIIDEEKVAVYTTVQGTHFGDLFGLAPTHKTFCIKQMQIEQIKDNQIVEHWRITDDLSMLHQLGQLT